MRANMASSRSWGGSQEEVLGTLTVFREGEREKGGTKRERERKKLKGKQG